MLDKIPCGINEIIETYGRLSDVPAQLTVFTLPYPLLFGETPVRRATCHIKAKDHFEAALEEVKRQGLQDKLLRFSGIYNSRVKRGSSKPSTHAWGIAGDWEAVRYPRGSHLRLPQEVVDIFSQFGFLYGGDFESGILDPMHFQLCRGY